MIDRAHVMLSVGTILAGGLLFAPVPASAQILPYAPSTTLPMLHIGSTTFPITAINDTGKSATAASGFASTAGVGDITFTFATPMDLTSFGLWNNIAGSGGLGGARTFTLEFFAGATSLGQTAHSVPNTIPPYQVSFSRAGVTRVVMHITSSYGRIEIREVEFGGRPVSFTQSCDAIRRLHIPLTTQTILRTSNAVDRGAITVPTSGSTGPYSYSVGPLRAYGDTVHNRVFVDSFPLVPGPGKHVCQIDVAVSGSSGSVANNDGLNVFLPRGPGQIYRDLQGWQPVGSPVYHRLLTDNLGSWTYTANLTGSNPAMAPALAAALAGSVPGGPFLDIFVHDDSVVTSAAVTYTLY